MRTVHIMLRILTSIVCLSGLHSTKLLAQEQTTPVEASLLSTAVDRGVSAQLRAEALPRWQARLSDTLVTPERKKNALGIDVLLSTSGVGLGVFYRRQYTEDLYGFGTFSISEVKDDREIELYDYWGNKFVPGKVNRFLLLPLIFGVQYRLFREEIADNFRPYVTAALGPSMVYSTPYAREFFNALKYGQAHYTLGGYIGFGAFFGQQEENVAGLSIRYYFVPLKNPVESLVQTYKKQFGGFFITFNFGRVY